MVSEAPAWIALIRAIGPATHKLMTMEQLRQACSSAGLWDVKTVLATGNLIFRYDGKQDELHNTLVAVLAAHGLENEVFLRRPSDLAAILKANPMPQAANDRPNHMLVVFLKSETKDRPLAEYEGPEQTVCLGREVYVDYVNGVAGSKLTSTRLEKLLGQSGTARNWNTVSKLLAKAEG